jgi:hypothetical protein
MRRIRLIPCSDETPLFPEEPTPVDVDDKPRVSPYDDTAPIAVPALPAGPRPGER